MKVRVTKNTDSHDVNPEYRCLVIDFEPSDYNFHASPQPNWMPTEEQILAIVQKLLEISPTFKEKVTDLVFREGKVDISVFM